MMERVVGINHPPKKLDVPVWERGGENHYKVELALMDFLCKERNRLKKSYKVLACTRWTKEVNGGMLNRNPYTMYATATRAGVHLSTLDGWERGVRTPKCMIMWLRWADALDLKFVDVLKKVTDDTDISTSRAYLDIQFDEIRNNVSRNGEVALFTADQAKYFGILFHAKGRTITNESIYTLMYEDDVMRSSDEVPDPKIMDIHKNRVNRKIRPLGLQIGTDWGVGKFLNTANKPYKGSVAPIPQAAD